MKLQIIFALLVMSIFTSNLVFAEKGTSLVDLGGITHEIHYDAIGLTVDGMEADVPQASLVVFITTTDVKPVLEITLDRDFLDSKDNGEDIDFIVLSDGVELLDYDETKNDSERMLTIQIPEGALSLDIIGTAFGSTQMEETASEEPQTPEEAPPETQEPEEIEEPQTQCGPGTVLQNGVCVPEPKEPEATPETQEPEEIEEPQTQCGPGTILKDGACVLDERCGPGTIFKDGQCVLADTEPQKTISSRGATFELVVGIAVAFIIGFIIMIVLWAIGRASRSKNNN